MKAPRSNKACSYFPCHKGLQDCTFCYCPFYPCGDENLGEYIFSRDKKIWSCKNCNWIHKEEVVDRIFKTLQKMGKERFAREKR